MTSITYKNLMKKCEEGQMEVTAWSGNYAEVTVWPSNLNKPPKRKMIEVTNIPADFRS